VALQGNRAGERLSVPVCARANIRPRRPNSGECRRENAGDYSFSGLEQSGKQAA
jgi:hypothetical protein